ncbi:MAG TPA: hypothetical protein VMV17_11890 [Streptosporangiaceae bacterium]|nr:hypothetical protein [Streptosporangiaceae bacterium]
MSISAQLAFVAALVGIEYTLSAGPVVTAGANRLVTLQVTMDDASSVPALTVGSMVIVSGVTYTSPRKGNDLPNGQAQKPWSSTCARRGSRSGCPSSRG